MYLHSSPSFAPSRPCRIGTHRKFLGVPSKIFRLPAWVHENLNRRGFGQAAAAAGGASLAASAITAGIGAALNVGTAIAGYMLQSAAQRDDTTNIVNFAATMLGQNSQAYNTCQISAAEAQSNFDQIWQWVVQQCSQPSMGTAGGSCVQERQAGGSIDWFKLYYDTYSNPPGPGNYVGAAGYPPTTAGCTMTAATAAASASSGTSTGCLSLFSMLGIQEPCLGPIGMYTAIAGGLLAFFALKDL